MTSPPPPNSPEPPRDSGGFGPPQGFGPPSAQPPAQPPVQPPAQPYGQQSYGPPQGGPAGGPGYGQPQGFGQYGQQQYGQQFAPPMPPPPPPSGGSGAKVAAIVVAVVLVAGLVVGGIILTAKGGGGDTKAKGKSSPSPSVTSSAPSADASGPGSDLADPRPSASSGPSLPGEQQVPYVVLKPGQCFDHPSLTTGISTVVTMLCSGTHDGEVISNATLVGSFDSEQAIQDKAKDLCESTARKRVGSISDGRTYYSYVLYPAKRTYDRGQNQITCTITRSITQGGSKLTEPLPD